MPFFHRHPQCFHCIWLEKFMIMKGTCW
jgi:hypothetical protein